MDYEELKNLYFSRFKHKRTASYYEFVINDIENFCQKEFDYLEYPDFKEYIDKCNKDYQNKNLSYTTLYNRYYVLKSFSDYMWSNRAIVMNQETNNPFYYIKAPESPYITREHIPGEDIVQVILNSQKNIQEKLILLFLIKYALRTTEILSLKKSGISYYEATNAMYANFSGKKKGNHNIKCNEESITLLNELQTLRKGDILFLNHRGKELKQRDIERYYKSSVSVFDNPPTMQDIRNGSIVSMIHNYGRDYTKEFTGLSNQQLARFDSFLETDYVDYSAIHIK